MLKWELFPNGDGLLHVLGASAARRWRDTDGCTRSDRGVTDSSCICLRLIYTPGCLALITSVI